MMVRRTIAMSTLGGTTKYALLMRRVAGLDVDKGDLRRLRDCITQKLYDQLVLGQAVAKANNRDIIEP
jgi:Domain of unknown function (DUF1931)